MPGVAPSVGTYAYDSHDHPHELGGEYERGRTSRARGALKRNGSC